MKECFHFTKNRYLNDIIDKGLKPNIGDNSLLLNDISFDKVSYSIGIDGAIEMFVGLYEIYINIKNSNDDRSNHYLSRRRLFYDVMVSDDFKSWQEDGLYLMFDGDLINNKYEYELFDCYTKNTIPVELLNVCILKNKNDNSFISYSMYDILNFWMSKQRIYLSSFYGTDYKDDINKFNSTDFYVEYMSLKEFYENYKKDFK